MQALISHTEKMFKPEEADRIAAELNADPDDDWTYEAVHSPTGTGYSFINIYDEDGEFVGKV